MTTTVVPLLITTHYLRHANAEQSSVDICRCITTPGRLQALRMEKKLKGTTYDVAIISPALRAYETAEIILRHQPNIFRNALEVQELYLNQEDSNDQLVDNMFGELGHATLATYLRHKNAGVLKTFAQKANLAIEEMITSGFMDFNEEVVRDQGTLTVLIVGDGALLPAIAARRCESVETHKVCGSVILGECECIEMHADELAPAASVNVITLS